MNRKVVLYIAMSVDGYIARENGDIDWLNGDGSDENADYGYDDFLNSIDTVIMGRTTYEQVLTFGEYPYKGKKGYVFTSKNIKSDENVEFTNNQPKALIKKLRNEKGKDIWLIGGAKVIEGFLKENLVDDYVVTVIPTILGKGIRLFQSDSLETKLKLTKVLEVNGMAMLHYSRR